MGCVAVGSWQRQPSFLSPVWWQCSCRLWHDNSPVHRSRACRPKRARRWMHAWRAARAKRADALSTSHDTEATVCAPSCARYVLCYRGRVREESDRDGCWGCCGTGRCMPAGGASLSWAVSRRWAIPSARPTEWRPRLLVVVPRPEKQHELRGGTDGTLGQRGVVAELLAAEAAHAERCDARRERQYRWKSGPGRAGPSGCSRGKVRMGTAGASAAAWHASTSTAPS